MAIYAVVQGGSVVNTVEWDGRSQWQAPEGCSVHEVPEGAYVGIGSSFDGTSFGIPPQPLPEVLP
jgi:hypothetical protein